jgi:hypothetical protein
MPKTLVNLVGLDELLDNRVGHINLLLLLCCCCYGVDDVVLCLGTDNLFARTLLELRRRTVHT